MGHNEEYWNERFSGKEPEPVKRAIKQVYQSYPSQCLPQGLSDPMYIKAIIRNAGYESGEALPSLHELRVHRAHLDAARAAIAKAEGRE